MSEPNDTSPSASTPSSSNREEASGASSSSSRIREDENGNRNFDSDDVQQHQFRNPDVDHHHISVSYRGNVTSFDDSSTFIRDDTWSCIIVVLTFWFFVSMTLILGVYGAVTLHIGSNSSILIQPNALFVETVKVEKLDDTKSGPKLYGFYKSPPLDNAITWLETHSASIKADSHKEWIHFLNEGSHINISYSVNSLSSSVILIIAQGNEGLAQWLEDPTYPNTTLSWNAIHGSGMIQQDIYRSSSYYVALGNLNTEEVEVELKIRIRALLYNTTEAYYKCTFTNGVCSLSVSFPKGNYIVLTSPGSEQDTTSDEWYVRVSYGARWITYIVGIGGMTVLMLVLFNFLNKIRCIRGDETGVQYGNMGSERAPLLSYKDDDLSSWGSSYDSVSNEEDDLEEFLAAGSFEGKSVRDGEKSNNTRRLCAICFDAPRDCFFLPCGHCVACFECGTRIAEASGTCPICRRNMKKVRKIFTV
ncbi:zf-C3HC4_3 domain-containing protein [Cephalotus follicularis]|uniref:Zf-C3HC4_3 domain-containing protein n=1 Tax=Cephalotus follicularis TaxID=3775 RepID=A0A1Q3C5G1_CEPFO|nr:zf-C3HC4_3 domain-containing protein [Cephalotus follicularis]